MRQPLAREVSEEAKKVARAALAVFGGEPSVGCYWDENNVSNVDILVCRGSPTRGALSVATVNFAAIDIGLTMPDGRPLRAEFVGAAYDRFPSIANMLSTCAFNVINSGYPCRPGEIHYGVVKVYYEDVTTRHVMLKSPWDGFWRDDLQELEFPDRVVAWIYAVPISEAEAGYAEERGVDALDELLAAKHIDVLDLNRPSVM
jgi:hypothetical protein